MKKLVFILLISAGLFAVGGKEAAALKTAYDGGHAASYFVPSWFYDGGISATKDVKKSLDMITKSCDIGYGEGCAEPARAYARSQNAQQDVKKEQIFTQKPVQTDTSKVAWKRKNFTKRQRTRTIKN